MKVMLDDGPFQKVGLNRPKLAELLAEGLGISVQKAALRLDRAISNRTTSLKRDVLALLLDLARQRNLPMEKVLRLESESVFDLLPGRTTYTYLGGYGPVEEVTSGYAESVTAAVNDYRAARRFAQRITRDYSHLRFAPSPDGGEQQVVEKLKKDIRIADESGHSILSIGSTKINTMSEWLMADALGLTPFHAWSAAQQRPPVEFVYAVSPSQKDLFERNLGRCNGRLLEPGTDGHSYLIWNDGPDGGKKYRYIPPGRPHDDGTSSSGDRPNKALGTDYAVVSVNALDANRGHVAVAGLTGAATFGAAALLCHTAEPFSLPVETPFVRLFLIEIKVAPGPPFRAPVKGRVLSHWTRSGRQFYTPPDAKFYAFGLPSQGQDPGDVLPAPRRESTSQRSTT